MRFFFNIFILLLIIFGCNSNSNPEKAFKKDETFPKVKKLNEFKKTIFVPTLETSFETKNNSIYAVSLLLAWAEIENKIAIPLIKIENNELKQMHNSRSCQNVLAENEYSSSVEIGDTIIKAKAYFKKSLPFTIPFAKDKEPLDFLGNNVLSFGFNGYNNEASKIIYYKNDDDFAIKLIPKEKNQEIILMKSNFNDNVVFKNEIERLNNLEKTFKKNKNEKNNWKYYYNDEDLVSIPIIEFNIETNYTKIEGSYFYTKHNSFYVDIMYQKTAFILNEKGAEVESMANIEACVEEMEEEIDLPKPKKMFFNKPYLIMLKRKNSLYPYFAMFVSNSELMKTIK